MSDPVASTSSAEDRPLTPTPPSASARGRSSGSEPSTKYGAILHTKQGSAREALLAAQPASPTDESSKSWLKPSRRLSGAKAHPRQGSRTRFARSRERSGQDEQDVFESDVSSDDGEDDEGRAGGRRFSRNRAASNTGSIWSRITVGRDADEESLVEESDKQWGVLQMELIQRIRGKRGLIGIYFGVYLLSILLSLESNLSPTIEPYFLSLLNSHSLLASLAIVTSLAHAVGKPPITKLEEIDTWVTMAVGFVVLIGFGFYEWSWAPVPMLPPRLFMNRTILAGAVLGFFHFASCFAYSSFFTSFLQVAREASPRDASYISESYIFAASLAAPVVGLLARQTKHYKWLVVSGVVVHVMGVLLMMRARRLDAPPWEIVLSQVLGGVGGAGTTLAGQLGCQAVVGTQDVGIATAIFLTVTTLGGAFGAAFAGSVWSADLPVRLYANLPDAAKGEVHKIMESLPYALSFEKGSPTRLAINASYVEVQQKLNGLAVVLLVPALVAGLMMRNVNLEVEERRRQEGVVLLGSADFEDETDVSESSSLLDHRA